MLYLTFNVLITVAPPIALRFYPYLDRLRIRLWKVFVLYGVLFVIQMVLYGAISGSVSLDFSQLQLFRFVYAFAYVAVPFFVIRESFFKLVFIWFITASYISILSRTATFLEIHFFGGAVTSLDFFTNNIILLCLVFATWLPLAYFLKHAIVPMLTAIDNSVARFIWLIPGLYLLNFTIYMTDLRLEQISNVRYLLLIVPLAGGIAISCYTLLRLLHQASEKTRLAAEVTATNRLLDLQHNQYRSIIEDNRQAQAIRHDMRHQLAVIKRHLRDGDPEGAAGYCDTLIDSVSPNAQRRFCENYAVNAIVEHYVALAEKEGIKVEIELAIPRETGIVADTDLCVIVGNLLENSIEACRGVSEAERRVSLRSLVRDEKLYLAMDNSFDGVLLKSGAGYRSRKHDGIGIGLASIQAVCDKYQGFSEFEAEGLEFRSSVMVDFSPNSDLA